MRIKILSYEGRTPVTSQRIFHCVEIIDATGEDGVSSRVRKPLGNLTVEGLTAKKNVLQEKIQDINQQIKDIEDWWTDNQK